MKVLVTGRHGQIAMSLAEKALSHGVLLVHVSRPEVDFRRPAMIEEAIESLRPDVIVNAAAYTAVDLAEGHQNEAFAVNAEAAGAVATTARRMNVPLIQISTDYVFDGKADRPYRETDETRPVSIYGLSKLAGETAVAAVCGNHAILRTAWVYSAFGKNFVKTMLRLGAERSEVGVVADQIGSPTSAHDIADAVLDVARHLVERPGDPSLRGVFHMAAGGEAVWADVAEAIFLEAEKAGRPSVRVKRIRTKDFPTPARRPANSRLDTTKLREAHGVAMPHWRVSLTASVARLVAEEASGSKV